jgi:hypothetical protein
MAVDLSATDPRVEKACVLASQSQRWIRGPTRLINFGETGSSIPRRNGSRRSWSRGRNRLFLAGEPLSRRAAGYSWVLASDEHGFAGFESYPVCTDRSLWPESPGGCALRLDLEAFLLSPDQQWMHPTLATVDRQPRRGDGTCNCCPPYELPRAA